MLEKLKNTFISVSLNFPRLTISIVLFITLIIISGTEYVVQDDDMVRLLPDDMQSIITFGEITEEFGIYEFMYVAMGIEGENALNKKLLNIAWDISDDFEKLEQCEEVISIAKMSKMYFDTFDSSIVVDDLMSNKITKNTYFICKRNIAIF